MGTQGQCRGVKALILSAVGALAISGCGGGTSASGEVAAASLVTANCVQPPSKTLAELQAEEWAAATAKAKVIAADMTRDELILLIIGASRPSTDPHRSAGYIPSLTVSKTGFVIPAQYLCDSPNGVGNSNTNVTRFPTGITVAATWDKGLAQAYGDALGAEWFGKGCTHGLGPGMNIVRLPYGGRTAEYYSEDPFLAAQIATNEILGIQAQHVVATAKHYAANNQEIERSGGNSSVDERTLREIYLPAFEASVKEGGAGALMCSYNRLNGTYACGNDGLQNGIARDDWGFAGLIMSDWGANHGTDATTAPQFALAGLDMDMPGGTWNATRLASLGDDYLRTMATRILAAMYKVGIFDVAAPVVDSTTDVSTAAHKALAEELSAAGTVLLKNAHGLLPLDATDAGLKIVVVGGAASAYAQSSIGGSGVVTASEPVVTPLAGIQAAAAGTVTYSEGALGGSGSLTTFTVAHTTAGATTNDGFLVGYVAADGTPLTRTAAGDAFTTAASVGRPSTAFLNGTAVSLTNGTTLWRGSWTGFFTVTTAATYEFNLTGNGTAQLRIDGVVVGTLDSPFLSQNLSYFVPLTAGEHSIAVAYDTSGLYWNPTPSIALRWNGSGNELEAAVAAATGADVAIVVVSDAEREGQDHSANLPGSQDLLVERVAAVARKTVVVMNTGSGLVLPWAGKVDAILENWYGGQRLGTAIAAILFGDVNPSGRSVVTFPVSTSQWYAQQRSQYPGVFAESTTYRTVSYDEGIFMGYRWFDENRLAPLFPFGHGLSYTTFRYSDLSVSPAWGDDASVTVRVKITNTGRRAGAEVAQLYVGFPDRAGEPPRQLKGFEKIYLEPRRSGVVTFTLDERAFEYWDAGTGDWVRPAGVFTLYVGSSSRDIREVTRLVNPRRIHHKR